MNAIRMLGRRITLLRAYLNSLPPSYLSDPALPLNPSTTAEHPLPINHTILRSISATLSRINILSPPDTAAFTLESQQESSDVQLIALLSSITNSVSTAKEFGKKSQIVYHARQQGRTSTPKMSFNQGIMNPQEDPMLEAIGGGFHGFQTPGERWWTA